MSDDATITLRTVLNVTHGFGLTFNIAERVQTYTHPLWMGLITLGYLAIGNVYVTTFAASIVCSLFAFWLVVTRANSPLQALTSAVVLLFSAAFVDFSTSGLENPLANLLLVVFVIVFLDETRRIGRRLTCLAALGSLLYLTRPDAIIAVVPLIALAIWRSRRQPGVVIRALLVGSVPAVVWTAFALVYYGFPFPNTAYAKLAMGIDSADLRAQGFLYLLDSVDRDAITLTTAAIAIVLAIIQNSPAARALAAGVALYLAYVVSIGGDFMSGRFLAFPLFASALLLSWLVRGPNSVWASAAMLLAIVGSTGAHVPLWSNSRYGDAAPKPSGIVDERAVYFREHSLLLAKRGTFRDPDWPSSPRSPGPFNVIDTCGLMGAAGIDFGPYIHLLDECALADPLLARLPAVFNPAWRTGHYRRMIPKGYRESLETSTNLIEDSGLHRFYDQLRLVTRASRLFTRERLRAIVALNTSTPRAVVNTTFYRHNGATTPLEAVSALAPPDAVGPHLLKEPLAITCPWRKGRRFLDVTLDSDDRYILTFLTGGRTESTLDLGPVPIHRRQPGLTDYTLDVPGRARANGFDTIVIAPVAGTEPYTLGRLLLEGNPATDGELYRRVAARDTRR